MLVILANAGLSADFYVSQNSSGDGSGSSSDNCKPVSVVNASWPASPGDIVHLVGTITNSLTIGGSGNYGNPVTVLFETGSKISAPFFSSGAIYLSGKSNIVIDGGSTGLIEATGNGTGMNFQTNSVGIAAFVSSFFTVRNLTIRNMYVRTNDSDESVANGYTVGIEVSANTAPYLLTCVTVSNCVISDASVGIKSDYDAGCSNYTFIGNTISNVNWGGNCGDLRAGSTMDNLVVANNQISGFSNWNDPSNNLYHHNGFYGWAESGGSLRNYIAYGNRIGPGWGGGYQTSGLFSSGNISNIFFYNNVFIANTNESWANGMIFIWQSEGSIGNFKVMNNTFIGGGLSLAVSLFSPQAPILLRNNLVSGVKSAVAVFSDTGALLQSDTNIFWNLNNSQAFSFSSSWSANYKTFSQWNALGYDYNSITNNPSLNSDVTLRAGSSAIGAGANLSGTFTTDYLGNARPSSGPWDIGAFQYFDVFAPVLRIRTGP